MALRMYLRALQINSKPHGFIRFASTSNHRVVITDDGSTIVAWHPKPDFPYECTKPLPKIVQEETPSVLKNVLTPELKQIFKQKTAEEARQELMNLTYTTKHRWFPRSRDKRAKKTAPDREYL